MRPGRCFDVMKTRLLTHKEMLAVVEAAGLESTPPWKEEYSACPRSSVRPKRRRRWKGAWGFRDDIGRDNFRKKEVEKVVRLASGV